MDEKTVTFEEKLTQLLELAKSKKNVLENKEILDFFHGEILNPDQLDQIYAVSYTHLDLGGEGRDIESPYQRPSIYIGGTYRPSFR